MTTREFLTTLRAHADLPLVFAAGGQALSPHYHLTEVKRVGYETMDCGAQRHRWAETQFELWVPPLAGLTPGRDPMNAGKFLRIVDRVGQELPLDDEAPARIHAELGGHPAALHDIAVLMPGDGRLLVTLTPDRTRCKAAERRLAALAGSCCGTGHGACAAPAPAAAACCA